MPLFESKWIDRLEGAERKWQIEDLCDYIMKQRGKEKHEAYPHTCNLVELLLYLCDIYGRSYNFPARYTFMEIYEENSAACLMLLNKHINSTNNRIALNAWNLLTSLAKSGETIPVDIREKAIVILDKATTKGHKIAKLIIAVARFINQLDMRQEIALPEDLRTKILNIIPLPEGVRYNDTQPE